MKTFLENILLCVVLGFPTIVSSQEEVTVYIDADYTLTQYPAEAIEAGLLAAIAAHPIRQNVRVVAMDNRANARRSIDTLDVALNDGNAIAVFGGMHSPHYLVNLEEINNNQMPLLLPWSAAGPLTRGAYDDQNWVFRLSVDDQKAGEYLYSIALKRGCQRPSVVAVDNSWGRYNLSNLQNAADVKSGILSETILLHESVGRRSLENAAERIDTVEADCLVLVTGFELGSKIISLFAGADEPIKILSHWGLLGGQITNSIGADKIETLDLEILGTCGLHQRLSRHALHSVVEGELPENKQPQNHPAPHGFYHAFDLGRLFLDALDRARKDEQWGQGIKEQRNSLRKALYNLEDTYEGLITDYQMPFQMVTPDALDGHEALGFEDLCMTRATVSGALKPVLDD